MPETFLAGIGVDGQHRGRHAMLRQRGGGAGRGARRRIWGGSGRGAGGKMRQLPGWQPR